jgi:putative peptide zinc metalloprotease protein
VIVDRVDGARIHPAVDSDDRQVIELVDGRLVRVSSPMVSLWQTLDGKMTLQQVAASLSDEWTEELVQQAVVNLGQAGLLKSGSDFSGNPRKRLKLGPLEVADNGSIQWTIIRNLERFRVFRRISGALAGITAGICGVLLGITGIIAMVVRWQLFQEALTKPVDFVAVIALFAFMTIATTLHELGHALRAVRVGGCVRRIGLMLLYLSPAMFCDITDTWRLHKKDRVSTALAGGVATAAISGSIALAFIWSGGKSSVLAALAVGMMAALALNLLPLVKYDGYIAWMTYLDIPYLRSKAMKAWKTRLAEFVGGTHYNAIPCNSKDESLERRKWVPVYGLLASAAPLVLLGLATGQLGHALSGLGLVGLVCRSLLCLVILALAVRGGWQVIQVFRTTSIPLMRTAAAFFVMASCLVALLWCVTVRQTVTTSYYAVSAEQALIVVPVGGYEELQIGQTVTLARSGLLLTEYVTRGQIEMTPQIETLPALVLSPGIRGGDEWISLEVMPARFTLDNLVPGTVGIATISQGQTFLGRYLFDYIIGDTVGSIVEWLSR